MDVVQNQIYFISFNEDQIFTKSIQIQPYRFRHAEFNITIASLLKRKILILRYHDGENFLNFWKKKKVNLHSRVNNKGQFNNKIIYH